ncbi:unnamed protein product [Ixodes hexagonus]
MGWLLAGNKTFLAALLVGYVYVVRYGGPRFMKGRKPYENLKPLILAYNFSMVLVNAYFLVNFLTRSYLGGGYNLICQGIDYKASDKDTMEVLELYWWYHWLRITDFLDTVFFVLRKKDSHVSLLHVGHHVLVVFNGWYGLAYGSDGQVTLTVVLNCFVHVLMYSYYFLSLLGPAVRPYLWWKRYLTGFQLVQFVVMFLHIMIPVFNECGYPKFHSVIIVCEAAFFFTMFARFYKKAYMRGRNEEACSKMFPATPIWDLLPRRDPRTVGWTLVGNKTFLAAVIAGYVYLVKVAGPRFMRGRKPYESLRPLIVFYNLAMVFLNAYFLVNFLSRSYLGGGYDIVCQGINFEARDRATIEYLELCWWYVWLRVADFLDTIFFVLRKKGSHVSFLHVSHHAIVVFNGWYGLAYGPDGQPALGITINSFVHVVMYSYYFLSLLGPGVRPYLWWKRHLTQLQLVQFAVMFTHDLIPLFVECGYPKFHMVLGIAELIFISSLFWRFYASAYRTRIDSRDKVQ